LIFRYVKNCGKNKDVLKRLEKSRKEVEIVYRDEFEKRQQAEVAYRRSKV